jgi:hypothetical protein
LYLSQKLEKLPKRKVNRDDDGEEESSSEESTESDDNETSISRLRYGGRKRKRTDDWINISIPVRTKEQMIKDYSVTTSGEEVYCCNMYISYVVCIIYIFIYLFYM